MAIEGVQAGTDRYPDMRPINTRADGAGIRAKRLLKGLIDAERASAADESRSKVTTLA